MRNNAGSSLMEVIIATTVGILVVTALTFATIFSLRNANFAKNSAQATKLAQQGIEKLRTSRDRNSSISIYGTPVDSWSGSNPIWNYQIKIAGGCENPSTGGKCYFNLNSVTDNLTNIGFAFVSTTNTPFPSLVEQVSYGNLIFKRAVILSDDASYTTQKIATVVVAWVDFSGSHESRLTTVLRKL
ncbi:MAG: hypothetical protein Q7R77_04510 [Candidatus Daviesbacteria bacterium]|nr:hypothetical protein [Candidatus Daviesbacteria bacterium]